MSKNQAAKIVVFTGARSEGRAFWSSMAREAGYIVKGSVTSETDLLVSTYDAAADGTTKWREANSRGVKIVAYGDFAKMV